MRSRRGIAVRPRAAWLRDPVWVASMTLLQFLQISRLFRMLLLSFVSSDVSG